MEERDREVLVGACCVCVHGLYMACVCLCVLLVHLRVLASECEISVVMCVCACDACVRLYVIVCYPSLSILSRSAAHDTVIIHFEKTSKTAAHASPHRPMYPRAPFALSESGGGPKPAQRRLISPCPSVSPLLKSAGWPTAAMARRHRRPCRTAKCLP